MDFNTLTIFLSYKKDNPQKFQEKDPICSIENLALFSFSIV